MYNVYAVKKRLGMGTVPSEDILIVKLYVHYCSKFYIEVEIFREVESYNKY